MSPGILLDHSPTNASSVADVSKDRARSTRTERKRPDEECKSEEKSEQKVRLE